VSHATETHELPAAASKRWRRPAHGDRPPDHRSARRVRAALIVDPARAWRAYYINWLFVFSIAQGGFMLAVVTSIAKGLWSRPIRRIALAHVAFLPIAFVAVLPILIWGRRTSGRGSSTRCTTARKSG
jgi:hypothetical protein